MLHIVIKSHLLSLFNSTAASFSSTNVNWAIFFNYAAVINLSRVVLIFSLYDTASMNSYSDALEKVDVVWTYLDKLLKNIIFLRS